MNKTYKTYLVLLGITLTILGVLELNKKQIIDWSLNYDVTKKSPFGLYILNQEFDSLFNDEVERITETPYTYLKKDTLTNENKNYFSIQKTYTEEAINHLLKKTNKGSNLFIASSYIDNFIKDTLNLDTRKAYSYAKSSIKVSFIHQSQKNDSILIENDYNDNYITEIDETTTQILAYKTFEEDKNACFIHIKYGKGNIYLLTQPLLLTNYYLIDDKKQKGIENIFSYLPNQKTIWFQDVKSKKSSNELQFILNNLSLRYAWYLVLLTLVLFVFFNAKRKQRIIPIIPPKVNKSIEFIKSVGNLYFQEGNPQHMAEKKVQYFLNKVRNELYINTDTLDIEFTKKLQQKTGKSIKEIEEGVKYINKIVLSQEKISEKELIKINHILDNIYQ